MTRKREHLQELVISGILNFFRYRERKSKYFNMYHSYSAESEELMLERGEDHRAFTLLEKTLFQIWMYRCFYRCDYCNYCFMPFQFNYKNIGYAYNKERTQAIENSVKLQEPKKDDSLTNEDVKNSNVLCYENIWVNDGIVTYKLNNGNYAYNPSYLIPRCTRILYRDKALE